MVLRKRQDVAAGSSTDKPRKAKKLGKAEKAKCQAKKRQGKQKGSLVAIASRGIPAVCIVMVANVFASLTCCPNLQKYHPCLVSRSQISHKAKPSDCSTLFPDVPGM